MIKRSKKIFKNEKIKLKKFFFIANQNYHSDFTHSLENSTCCTLFDLLQHLIATDVSTR